MPKQFFTERDIDDLYARGVTSIETHDGIVLTDLARERCFRYGIAVRRVDPSQHKADLPQEEVVHRVKAAILARLGSQIDAGLLDTVVRRVVAAMWG
jgi:hypothetical protein